MSFVSPEFALLALLFFPLYWWLARWPGVQRAFLMVSGYGLYASWSLPFAGVLLLYSLTIWALGRWIARACDTDVLASATQAPPAARQRLALSLGLVLCVLFLVVMKYYEFLREALVAALEPLGWTLPLPILDMVAPVGVSFFTFQAITYLVSCHRPGFASRRLDEVLLFLAFWPTLFAGPILRAERFFAQIDAGSTGRPLQAWRALYLIVLGALQKLVFSAWLAETFVDGVFRYPEQHGGLAVVAAVVGYTLQIFLDFAGYTLIVTGLGLLLGFVLPQNFNHPYLARNLQEFWQRWHMSLSSFIRDYIYIPLGGNRRGFARTQFNLVMAMLISGAWHGANWTFIVWGLMHGLGTAAYNVARHRGWRPLPAWLAHGSTWVFVALAWLFFRASSLDQALSLLAQLGSGWAGWANPDNLPVGKLALLCVAFFWLSRHAQALETAVVQRLHAWGTVRAALALGLAMWAVIALGPEGVPGFIYYQF